MVEERQLLRVQKLLMKELDEIAYAAGIDYRNSRELCPKRVRVNQKRRRQIGPDGDAKHVRNITNAGMGDTTGARAFLLERKHRQRWTTRADGRHDHDAAR